MHRFVIFLVAPAPVGLALFIVLEIQDLLELVLLVRGDDALFLSLKKDFLLRYVDELIEVATVLDQERLGFLVELEADGVEVRPAVVEALGGERLTIHGAGDFLEHVRSGGVDADQHDLRFRGRPQHGQRHVNAVAQRLAVARFGVRLRIIVALARQIDQERVVGKLLADQTAPAAEISVDHGHARASALAIHGLQFRHAAGDERGPRLERLRCFQTRTRRPRQPHGRHVRQRRQSFDLIEGGAHRHQRT